GNRAQSEIRRFLQRPKRLLEGEGEPRTRRGRPDDGGKPRREAGCQKGRSRSFAPPSGLPAISPARGEISSSSPYARNSFVKYAPKSGRSFSALPSASSNMPALKR